MSAQSSFKEQMAMLINNNIDDCPDAIEWLRNNTMHLDFDGMLTVYEKFMDRLENGSKFANHPYDPVRDNFVEFIKWYRRIHNTGLKVAKEECEQYVSQYYADSERGRRYRGSL